MNIIKFIRHIAPMLVIGFTGLVGIQNIGAHGCGPGLKLTVGERGTIVIKADVREDQESVYGIKEYPDPNIAVVLPENINLHYQETFKEAKWVILAKSVGKTSVKANWFYEPNDQGGDCVFQIEVVAEEEDEPESGLNHTNSVATGDPVNTYTGEFIHYENPDLDLGGSMNLHFRRFYASRSSQAGFSQNDMGRNWSHNFDYQLLHSDNFVDVIYPGGEIISFSQNQDGEWQRNKPEETNFRLREGDEGESAWLFADPRNSMVLEFSASGNLIRISDGRGNELILTHEAGALTSVTDNRGRQINFVYSGFHHVSEINDGVRTVRFRHIGDLLTQVTDVLGNTTQYEYDFTKAQLALLTEIRKPEGNVPIKQEYDESGRVIRQTNADEGAYVYNYTPGHVTITDPLGRNQTHHYDSNGNLESIDFGDGIEKSYQYSDAGRKTDSQLRNGSELKVSHDPVTGELTEIITPDGLRQTASYSSYSLLGFDFPLISALSPQQNSIQFYEYDEAGRLTGFTDPLGNKTTYEYNNSGLPVKIIHPDGGTELFTYNNQHDLTAWTDPNGYSNEYEYDNLRRLNKVTEAGTVTLRLEYNAANRIVSASDESGNSATLEYDKNGNLKKYTGLGGGVITYSYDSMDRLVSISGPDDYRRTAEYNSIGKPVKITDSTGGEIEILYDRFNYPSAYIDEKGNKWEQTYTPSGDLVSTKSPDGEILELLRDWEGVIRSVTIPGRGTYQFEFSDTKDPIAAVDPQGNKSAVSFNAAGKLQQFTDPTGRTINYTYNSLGNLTSLRDSLGNQWLFEYDAAAQLTATTDPSGHRETRSYDGRGRLTEIMFPDSGDSMKITYSDQDTIASLEHPQNFNVNLGLDPENGEITSAGIALKFSTRNGSILESNGIAAAYDSEFRLSSLGFEEDKSIAYTYDTRGLLTDITDWLGHKTTLVYNQSGKLTEVQRSSGTHTSIEYNENGQEIRRTHHRGESIISEIRLRHDSSGHLVGIERNPRPQFSLVSGTEDWNPDPSSRITGMTWDPRGRLISDGKRILQWDAANRLTTIIDGQNITSWEYDSEGNPVSQNSNGQSAELTWNYATARPTLHSISGNTSILQNLIFIYSPSGYLLYAVNPDTGERLDYLFDERGNTNYVTSSTGDIMAQYYYDPYGRLLSEQTTLMQPFKFQGALGHLSDTGAEGLIRMSARIFDSQLGRFLSPDPVRRFLGAKQLNPYAYARNNPVGMSDPDGRDAYILQTSSIHTEIAVDIYDAAGNHAGYAQFDFNPVGSAFGVSNQGAVKGVFYDNFRDYPKNKNLLGMVRLKGNQAQDIRLLNKLLEMQGFDNSNYNYSGAQIRDFMSRKDATPDIRACLMQKMGFSSTTNWINFLSGDMQTYGDYSLFPGKSRYCNQFVNDMLGTFFGANWPDTVTLLPGELILKAGAFQGLGEGVFAWAVIHGNNINPINRLGIELGSTGLAIIDSIFE